MHIQTSVACEHSFPKPQPVSFFLAEPNAIRTFDTVVAPLDKIFAPMQQGWLSANATAFLMDDWKEYHRAAYRVSSAAAW